jgi:hypothetical protein
MLGIKLTQNTEGGRAHAYVSQVMLLSYFLQGARGIDLHILFLQTSVRLGTAGAVSLPCFRALFSSSTSLPLLRPEYHGGSYAFIVD